MFFKSWFRSRSGDRESPLDIAFIISEYNRGWVLETICRQIAAYWAGRTELVWTKRNRKITAPIPPARVYWFSHFQLLITALERNPEIHAGRLMVWFTHPSKPEVTKEQLITALNHCHAVIFTCSLHRDEMVAQGVRLEIAHVVLGAADPDVFRVLSGISRDRIGFATAYYERKNPELMEEIVRTMPEHEFLLIGPKADSMARTERMWTEYPNFDRLVSLPNLEYIESDYEDYPRHFNRMKVYVSTSQLEGGPISLIEAIACGCVPVATDTGFARDVIGDLGQGSVLPVNSGVAVFREAIQRASKETVGIDPGRYSWQTFAGQLHKLSISEGGAEAGRREALPASS